MIMTVVKTQPLNLDILLAALQACIPKVTAITWSAPNQLQVIYSSDFTYNETMSVQSIIASHVWSPSYGQIAIPAAMDFGRELMRRFVEENVDLGITQLGLTNSTRKTLREVKDCIDTGSLYDAITEIRLLNPLKLDAVILTPDRLLSFRNEIEKYLGVPLATSWFQLETWH